MSPNSKLISIVIPCRNEEQNIPITIDGIQKELTKEKILFEIIVVNDGSEDRTEEVVREIIKTNPSIFLVNNEPPHGIGNAIKKGLDTFKGDYVVIVMADASDDPVDIVKYIRVVEKGYDCCFGNRWKGATVKNYPIHKQFLNRFVNGCISLVFGIHYTDVTNAFKCYSRSTIEGIKPILAHHFNITVELPLKAMVRGYTYSIVPTNWFGRKHGITSLKINEMGSRYLFIVLYVLLEKWLAKSDYKKK